MKLSEVLRALNAYLAGKLKPLGFGAVLHLKQLGAADIAKSSFKDKHLYSAVEGLHFEDGRLRISMSSLLIAKQHGKHREGLPVFEVAALVAQSLDDYGEVYLDGSEMKNLRGQNLSSEGEALVLWGFTYELVLSVDLRADAELVDMEALGEFLEAGGNSQLVASEIAIASEEA